MKTNRQLKRLLEMPHWSSNTQFVRHRVFFGPSGYLVCDWLPIRKKQTPKHEFPEEVCCQGCEKWGEPNYCSRVNGHADQYYCGGSPRRCP